MTENILQKAIIDFLRYKGHYCQRVNSGMIMTSYGARKQPVHLADAGTPDIIACINGVFIGIEVKKSEAEVKKWARITTKFSKDGYVPHSYKREIAQYKEHCKIRKAGGEVAVVGSMAEFENDYNYLIKKYGSEKI